MITLKMSAVTGSGFDKTVLAPAIENKIMEGRKVLVIYPVSEMQKQFESFFADKPIEPVVTTTWRIANRTLGIGDADLVVTHSL